MKVLDEPALAALQADTLKQTALIPWLELQPHFARGHLIAVSVQLDLIDVAIQLSIDNTQQFQAWIDQALVIPATDAMASDWHDRNASLWSTVVMPWVLVQERPPKD